MSAAAPATRPLTSEEFAAIMDAARTPREVAQKAFELGVSLGRAPTKLCWSHSAERSVAVERLPSGRITFIAHNNKAVVIAGGAVATKEMAFGREMAQAECQSQWQEIATHGLAEV